jgi:hypothetical protein
MRQAITSELLPLASLHFLPSPRNAVLARWPMQLILSLHLHITARQYQRATYLGARSNISTTWNQLV